MTLPTVVTAAAFRDMVDEARRGEREFAVVDTRPTDDFESWRIADSINYSYKPFHEFDRDEFERETGLSAADRGVEYEFEPLARNETVDLGGVDVKALATPGHTDDMASYLVGRSAVLIGDTLFTDSVGRTELQFAAGGEGADAEAAGAETGADRLYDSLHATLLAEPDDVVVCPGHFTVENDGTTGDVTPGEPVVTTVRDARHGIDLLSANRERFVERITATLPEKPPNYESVIAANRGVDAPEDEVAAIELELGPNRCAAEAAPEPNAADRDAISPRAIRFAHPVADLAVTG